MLETGASGSVRGGDGNIPTYSAGDAAQGGKVAGEGGRLGECGEIAEEVQPAGVVRIEQRSRNRRRNSRERTWTGRKKPGRQAIQRAPSGDEAAARHDAMDVRVMGQSLAPGVEHRDDADLGAEMLGIGARSCASSRPRP